MSGVFSGACERDEQEHERKRESVVEPRFEVEPINPLMARLPEMFEELLTHTRESNKKAKSDSRWAKILGVIVAVETLGLIVLGYVTWQATL